MLAGWNASSIGTLMYLCRCVLHAHAMHANAAISMWWPVRCHTCMSVALIIYMMHGLCVDMRQWLAPNLSSKMKWMVQYHEIVHVILREWHHITILIIYAITITFVLLTCTHVIFKYDYHGWMASRIVYVCSLAPHIQYPPSAWNSPDGQWIIMHAWKHFHFWMHIRIELNAKCLLQNLTYLPDNTLRKPPPSWAILGILGAFSLRFWHPTVQDILCCGMAEKNFLGYEPRCPGWLQDAQDGGGGFLRVQWYPLCDVAPMECIWKRWAVRLYVTIYFSHRTRDAWAHTVSEWKR